MDLIEMYPAAVNSKVTVTLGVLNADSTIIEVLDGSVLPDAPNLLVLGSDQTAETVKLIAKEGNTLTVERGIQGNAIAWPAGTQVARNFTAKDWDDLVTNVATIVAKIMGLNAADVGALPISGGTLTGALDVNGGTNMRTFKVKRTVNSIVGENVVSVGIKNSKPVAQIGLIQDGAEIAYLRIIDGDTVELVDSSDNTTANILTTGNMKNHVLPLDGSVPMTGSLVVDKGTQYSAVSVQRIVNDILGKAGIAVAAKDEKPVAQVVYHKDNVETARLQFDNTFIRLVDVIGGKAYMLYGENNKELLSGEELSLTISSNIVKKGGLGIRYYKNADNDVRVHISIDIENKNLQNYTVIGQLPVGYRPADTSYFPSTTTSGGNAFIRIKADGEIAIDVKTETETETRSFVALAIFKAAN